MDVKLVIVTNPLSKFNKNGLIAQLKEQYPNIENFVKDLDDYPQLIEFIITKVRPDAIILSTGDGGGHNFFDEYSKYNLLEVPPVIMLPSGTFNLHARAVGHRGLFSNPMKIMGKVAALDDIVTFDNNLIEMFDGTDRHVGFCATNGIVSNFFDVYNQNKSIKEGANLIAKSVISFMLDGKVFNETYNQVFTKQHMSLEFNEQKVEGDFHGFSASSIPMGFLGMGLPYEKDIHLIAGAFTRKLLAENLLRAFTRNGFNAEVNTSSKEIFIDNCGNYLVDGESYHSDALELSLIPARYVKI